MNVLKCNGERLWQSLMDMAKVGATDKGGNCRMALSEEDRAGRELFIGWCREAGMSITFDAIGNLFARLPGLNDQLPPVVMGSHLDTQPKGGRFDGIYGVLCGLEVVRSLADAGYATSARSRSPYGPTKKAHASRPPCSALPCSPAAWRWTPR